MYFTPEDFFYVFIRLLSQVFIRDAPGISEKDENRSKSTKVTMGRMRGEEEEEKYDKNEKNNEKTNEKKKKKELGDEEE